MKNSTTRKKLSLNTNVKPKIEPAITQKVIHKKNGLKSEKFN